MINLQAIRQRARKITAAVFGHAVDEEARSIGLLAKEVGRSYTEIAVDQMTSEFKGAGRG